MRGRTRTKTFLAFALGAAFLTVPSMAEGQRGTQQGRLRSLGPSVDLLESALQTGDEIGLTPEQRARLEELQTEFLERAASARELVDAQRAQLREEMERLRSEREEAVAELRAMLTEEQVRQLQSVAREQRLPPDATERDSGVNRDDRASGAAMVPFARALSVEGRQGASLVGGRGPSRGGDFAAELR